MAHKLRRPTAAIAPGAPLQPQSTGRSQTLSGVLLLVPILAVLALAGIALALAAVFSIGFWSAFGWTAFAVVGALLLALAIAILRGK